MSIPSVLNPAVWACQIAARSPLAAAARGATSFASTLLGALQQAGTAAATASTGAAGASTAQVGTAPSLASAVHGHHRAHHGGGQAALQALLQKLQAGSASAAGGAQLLNTEA